MLFLNVRIGQAVKIGDEACVRVDQKEGRAVRLACFTARPLDLLTDGIIPQQFTLGVTGVAKRPPRILEPLPQPSASEQLQPRPIRDI